MAGDSAGMKKLLRFYPTLAVIGFNVILFTLAGLWLLQGALELRHEISGKSQVVHSDGIDLSTFRRVSRDTAARIAKNHDDWGSTQPFVFNPWTTFMPAPYASAHINVEEGTVLTSRRNGPADGSDPEAGGKPFVVWAFGGSTLFGFGVSDELTIPAFLQQRLSERLTERAVRVVNFGQPYWTSSVEVAALLALLRVSPAPDAVIFLDGLNDVSWGLSGYRVPVFAARGHQAWERERRNAKRALPWFTVNESFPLTRVIRGLRSAAGRPVSAARDPYVEPGARNANAVFASIAYNHRMLRALAEANGIKAFVFLQPTPWFGTYRSEVNPSFAFGDVTEARAVYAKLIDESRHEGTGFLHDLSGALHGFDKPYLDSVHYADAANRALAVEISAVIAEAFAPN